MMRMYFSSRCDLTTRFCPVVSEACRHRGIAGGCVSGGAMSHQRSLGRRADGPAPSQTHIIFSRKCEPVHTLRREASYDHGGSATASPPRFEHRNMPRGRNDGRSDLRFMTEPE